MITLVPTKYREKTTLEVSNFKKAILLRNFKRSAVLFIKTSLNNCNEELLVKDMENILNNEALKIDKKDLVSKEYKLKTKEVKVATEVLENLYFTKIIKEYLLMETLFNLYPDFFSKKKILLFLRIKPLMTKILRSVKLLATAKGLVEYKLFLADLRSEVKILQDYYKLLN